MRTRDEVLREFLPESEWDDYDPQAVMEAMADRIRELEAQQAASEPVAWCTQDEYGRFGELFATKADALEHSAEAFPLYAHPSAAAVRVDVDALSERVMSEFSSLAEYAPASAITPPRHQVFYGVRFSDVRNALRAALTAASEGASA